MQINNLLSAEIAVYKETLSLLKALPDDGDLKIALQLEKKEIKALTFKAKIKNFKEVIVEENVCLLEILNEQCCCKCACKDESDQTCCDEIYVVKEHGYCQGFKEKKGKENE